MQADFNNVNEVIELFNKTISWCEKLDILINNAGMTIMNSIDLDDTTWINNWNTIMKTNLSSVFRVTKEIVRDMMKQRYGRIINIASRAAFRGECWTIQLCSIKSWYCCYV